MTHGITIVFWDKLVPQLRGMMGEKEGEKEAQQILRQPAAAFELDLDYCANMRLERDKGTSIPSHEPPFDW